MKSKFRQRGQSLIELLLAIAFAGLIMPALFNGFYSTREGKAQQNQRLEAVPLFEEAQTAVRSVREKGWAAFAVNGTFHPVVTGTTWSFFLGAEETPEGFMRSITVGDVNRDASGNIVASGGTKDPSTKRVVVTVSWGEPLATAITSTSYYTRHDNLSYTETTTTDFNRGTLTDVTVTDTQGGEVSLSDNTKAQWCSPQFSSTTIDLSDGPPVAVAATSSASINTPNDILAATAPLSSSSVKMAHVNVTANTDPPVSTLRGTFTLDPTKYSSPGLVPSGIGLDNNFITNDIKYYQSPSGRLYALIPTSKPDREVIVVLVNDGNDSSDSEYQDPVNDIFKYWTFFNTRIYQGNTSAQPNQDYSPYSYGASSVAVFENRGYVTSGGYLYVFDLSNIDSKTPTSGLDMVGCRLELYGYDCNTTTSRIRKYNAGATGSNWGFEQNPPNPGCLDGGNVEKYADNDVVGVRVGSSVYAFVAVGSATNPEFEIVNVTNVPTSSTSPRINSSQCGTNESGSSGWSSASSLDFNSVYNTEEVANSVFAKSDGSRAYISSNGGIDADNNGQPDSKQFYVINTSNKNSPSFFSGSPSGGPTSGYYYGSGANAELYPRRSMTVLNGQRAVLVGKDGVNNGNNAFEYQVLNIDSETAPTYCGGVDFDSSFNGLASVIEADTDTFVYMVTNSTSNELRIIQGGPDGRYLASGTFESGVFDVGYSGAFNRFTNTVTLPAQTDLLFQIATANTPGGGCEAATYTYLGPDGTADTFYPATGGQIFSDDDGTGYENPARCFRYKGFFSTTDQSQTPILYDMNLNYSP